MLLLDIKQNIASRREKISEKNMNKHTHTCRHAHTPFLSGEEDLIL